MRKIKLDELKRLTVEEFKNVRKQSAVVILDDVRSLNNVGSVFRTSDAFRIDKIYLCGITGCPPHRDIHKTALGSENSVDWVYESDVNRLVSDLVEEGYLICAVEQAEGSVFLNNFNFVIDQKYAFVFGNEVDGVRDEIIKKCDFLIEIPQFGYKHSLNISIAAGIVLWDYTFKTNQFLA